VTASASWTSLGVGKADNCRSSPLDSRASANQKIFDGRVADNDRRHHRLREVEPFSTAAMTEQLADMAVEEAITKRPSGPKETSSPMFFPSHRSKRMAARKAVSVQARAKRVTYRMLREAATGRYPNSARSMFGSVADHIAEPVRHQRMPISLSTACASGSTAIQLGVEASAGETMSRSGIGADGSINQEAVIPLLVAFGALHRERTAEAAAKPFSKTATASSWPKVRPRSCRKPRTAKARGAKISA